MGRPGLMYVPDLGSDKVRQLRLQEGGELEELEALCFREMSGAWGSGGGPRHIAVHPSLDVCYCLHELGSFISAVAVTEGRLTAVLQQGFKLEFDSLSRRVPCVSALCVRHART